MELKKALGEIFKKAQEEFNIKNTPQVHLKQDEENYDKGIFGQTAYYNPNEQSIILFVTNRHPKDICRSFAHELVHHHQNERGDLEGGENSPTYAQDDPHMRKMEMEAYLKGNMLFRDWEDWMKNYRNTNS
tara:strand:- start:2024 stop:2416 length:393 start_codon:yes stop_codon:yes gene_type:complete